MNSVFIILLFLLGLILIIKGGDLLVDSAIFIAKKFDIPAIIIGTSLVSFLTTIPELTVSVSAIKNNSQGIAVGNAIGSTICNIGLILGFVLIFNTISVDKKMFRNKSGIMILALVVLVISSLDGRIELIEAIVLFMIVVLFFVFNFLSQKRRKTIATDIDNVEGDLKKEILFLILSSFMVFIGSKLLVKNGILIAKMIGVPESVIGLTMVAVGTSLPELVAVSTAVKKGEQNLAIGNVIGANILNIALIIPVVTFFAGGTLVLDRSNFTLFGYKFTNAIQTLILDAPFSLILMLIMSIPLIISGKTKKIQALIIFTLYVMYIIILYGIY